MKKPSSKKGSSKRAKRGTLEWFEAFWAKNAPSDPKKMVQALARLSWQVDQMVNHLAYLDGVDEEVAALGRAVKDLGVGYRVLSARLSMIMDRMGADKAPEPFPKLGKDGMVMVRGTPHLPECEMAMTPKKRGRRIVPSCTCGSVGEREKRFSLN